MGLFLFFVLDVDDGRDMMERIEELILEKGKLVL